MSDQLRGLRRDLRPVLNVFRGYRLFFSLLFWLTLIVVGGGILLDMWSQQKQASHGTPNNRSNQIGRTH